MIISFIGHSGAGKTTLIEKIIDIISSKGLKIGTIKHSHHNFEIDIEGKDSYRHFHSGATTSMIVSEEKIALIKRGSSLPIKNYVEKYFDDCQLIILEGFKKDDIEKIEVYRKDLGKKPLYKDIKGVLAVATDTPLEGVKNLSLNNPQEVAGFILDLLLQSKRR